MEILRKNDTTSISVTLNTSLASQPYTLSYEDLITGETFSASATSTNTKMITFTLDDRYLTYAGYLQATMTDASANYAMSIGIDVVKPYCDIDLAQSKLEINTTKAVQCERLARMLIESQAGNFQFVRKSKDVIGMSMDYLPVGERMQTLYRVWVNGELVHDSTDSNLQLFKIGRDRVSLEPIEGSNLVDYPIVWNNRYLASSFVEGYNYTIDADFGYPTVPEDIQEACELILQDISGDNMKFVNRNIQEFDNREFKIKFAGGFNTGTGNLIADNILAKYKNRILPGVL